MLIASCSEFVKLPGRTGDDDMSETADLVREIIQAVDGLHVLATVDAEGRPRMRWIGALLEDPQEPWIFYLVSGVDSGKMREIAQNPNAQLLFCQMDPWRVASLSGVAEAVDTPELRQLLWDSIPAMETYFTGAEDRAMGIIRFTSKCAEVQTANAEPHCFDL